MMERRTLWGGGIDSAPGDSLWRYTVDPVDRRLLAHDVRGSQAHVAMLGEQGILSAGDVARLQEGLATIAVEAETGEFRFLEGDEDVHTAVERRLVDLVGEVGGMLHTGRSRNDQVALDLRLYLVDAVAGRTAGIRRLVAALADQAEQHAGTVVPTYTHLQQAQAVPLGHHLLAHAWMLRRDGERFADAGARIAVSPLGAGAAAGSSLALDPAAVARELGMPAVFANSIDAVGARDWVAEYVFACAQTMVHLSRLAEELVLWSTTEFGWARFDGALTTGSSALPQKRNPDMAELVRGRTASVIGDVTAVLALQKGLPLAYNRDLQEDKAIVFHADDTVAAALEAMTSLVEGARFDPPLPGSSVLALDLAEVLVARGVPFRRAHAVVARLATRLAAESRQLDELTAAELTAADPAFVAEDLAVLDVTRSPGARRTPGAASPASVAAQLTALRTWLEEAPGA
jgi:argininosuccinate lyase